MHDQPIGAADILFAVIFGITLGLMIAAAL